MGCPQSQHGAPSRSPCSLKERDRRVQADERATIATISFFGVGWLVVGVVLPISAVEWVLVGSRYSRVRLRVSRLYRFHIPLVLLLL